MSDFAQIVQHGQHEQRTMRLGAGLLLAVIIFILTALIHDI